MAIELSHNLESLLEELGTPFAKETFELQANYIDNVTPDDYPTLIYDHDVDGLYFLGTLHKSFLDNYRTRKNFDDFLTMHFGKWFNAKYQSWNLFKEWRNQIGFVLDEAVYNAVRHGNQEEDLWASSQSNKKVTVDVHYSDKGVLYSIRDEAVERQEEEGKPKVGFDVIKRVEDYRREGYKITDNWGYKNLGMELLDKNESQLRRRIPRDATLPFDLIASWNYQGANPPKDKKEIEAQKYGSNALLFFKFNETK